MSKQNIDRLFKAFADVTRLRILNLLARHRELCVCELIEILRMGQSKVSRHLAYLRKAGLVKDRKAGLWSYYSLIKPQSRLQKQLLQCLGQCFNEWSILKKDRETFKGIRARKRK